MRVEILHPFRHQELKCEPGDRLTIDDVTGAYWCEMGWSKDLAGVAVTQPLDKNRSVTLDVQSIELKHNAESING